MTCIFPLEHFSENWGFVSLSPMLGGNVFSIAFGRNLDAHSDDGPTTNSTAASLTSSLASSSTLSPLHALSSTSVLPVGARGGIPDPHHCIVGRECYADSLKMTIVACCLALALGIYAGWRDYKRQKRWASRAESGPAVVIWESED